MGGAAVVGILVAFVVGAVAGGVVWSGRRRAAPGTTAAVDDSRFRQAIQRLGAAFAARDRDAIVDVILETVMLAVDADAAVFYVTPSPQSALFPRATRGVTLHDQLAAGAGVAGRAAVTDEPVLWQGGDAAPSPSPGEPLGATTAAAVPIHSSGRLLGVVAVYANRAARSFTPSDLVTLATVVRQAEVAIDNVLLHEEAERLSITDGLTGVWNRRHLDLRMGEELRRSRRFGEPFSLVLLDVDDFKRVNDTYGHQAGDAVLVELAARLTGAVREVDTVARYGGEEFCLLLPRTTLHGAVRLAEKVRAAIADAPFPLDGRELAVTVSLGVASHPAHGSTATDLLSAVDMALYRAKSAGKNRVVAAGGERVVEGQSR